MIWILISLEAAKITNESNQNPKPNYQVRGDPYVDQNPQSAACWHLHMLKKIKQLHGDPFWWIKKEEHEIDFRVPGLPHAVVNEAEHLRVQEHVKKIENHNVYNPFSKDSKEMIRELGNVELFDLCDLYQKYNVLTVFFIGIKELCTALADNAWFKANPGESLTN